LVSTISLGRTVLVMVRGFRADLGQTGFTQLIAPLLMFGLAVCGAFR
jgi:hypothetical protein